MNASPPLVSATRDSLPAILRPFFWDHDFAALDWRADRDFIVERILVEGTLDALRWLRSQLGDEELKRWLIANEGRALSKQQLRFWQVVLGLPEELVNRWKQSGSRQIWEERVRS